MATRVSGIINIDGAPAARTVRAFGYNPEAHEISGQPVDLSKTLGQATSAPETGEYTINLLGDYSAEVFVVAFDAYGIDFFGGLLMVLGERVHPTTPNGFVYECTAGGQLPESEPASWSTDEGSAENYGGTVSLIAVPFYRPMVHGPVFPELYGEPTPAPVELPDRRYEASGYHEASGASSSSDSRDVSAVHETFNRGSLITEKVSIEDDGRGPYLKFDGDGYAFSGRMPLQGDNTIIAWLSIPVHDPDIGVWIISSRSVAGSGAIREKEFQLINYKGQTITKIYDQLGGGIEVKFPTPPDDELFMVTVTVEGDSLRIYKNGLQMDSATINGSSRNVGAITTAIGIRGWENKVTEPPGGSIATGKMDLYRMDLYFSKALPASRILEIYNEGL